MIRRFYATTTVHTVLISNLICKTVNKVLLIVKSMTVTLSQFLNYYTTGLLYYGK